MVFFDCDSTLSAIEGIDELARIKGLFDEVQQLTDAAMGGDLHLEAVYDKRLQLLEPTRGEIRQLARLYRETLTPDAGMVIKALQYLKKDVFIVSGGLHAAVSAFGEWLGVPAQNIKAVDVDYNTLSGDWWNYQKDQWGERPDSNYLRYDDSPLAKSHGKADVVRQFKTNRHGRGMLVGDGMSDMAAREAVARLVGFGGVIARQSVIDAADIFIYAKSLSPVLALATSAEERARLSGTPMDAILQKGLALLADDQGVAFKKETWRQSALRG